MCILGDLLQAPVIKDKMEHVKASALTAPSSGLVLEFGVAKGASLKVIAEVMAPRIVYGFDSFKGLPRPWVRSETASFPAGHFGLEKPIDPPRENTRLVIGLIEETLPKFLAEHTEPLAFLHVVVDLGDVTAQILRLCGPRLLGGAIIRFDEFCDWGGYNLRYPGWAQQEYKALVEWLEASGKKMKPVSRDSFEGATFSFP